MKPGNFLFYPGAMFYNDHGGMGVYVRHHANKRDIEPTVVDRTPLSVEIHGPHRDVMIVQDMNRYPSSRQLDSSWEEYIDWSPFGRPAKAYGVDRIMVNMPQHLNKMYASHGLTPHVRIQSDSGGFQLINNKIDYLDPMDVINWYNKNVHEGMVLDIPIPFADFEMGKRGALIQKHNTEILVNNAREDLEFLNIIHGANYETYARYHDIVQRDDLDMLSIASIYRSEIVKSIHTLAKIINHGKRYKQYHLLGIYNIAMVAPLIWFAQKMGVNISTDASTHVKSGINRMFHSQHLPTSPVSRLIIGNNGGVPPSRNNFTPCSCPVCTNVKYMDILAYVPGSTATFALVLHNMFETIRYVDMMCDAAKTLNSNQYIELMKKQLGNHSTKESSVKAIRLIDEIVEHGIAKAEKKFSYFLSESMTEDLLANPLIAEEDNGDEPEMTVDAFKERVWSMIRTYEERDGTRLTKMKTKKKGDKKERGHVLSTKGHTRPGKKKKKIKKKVLVNAAAI
jgi:hypothetical protein